MSGIDILNIYCEIALGEYQKTSQPFQENCNNSRVDFGQK